MKYEKHTGKYCKNNKHLWIEENIGLNSVGKRFCKLCETDRKSKRDKEKRAKYGAKYFSSRGKELSYIRKYNITLDDYNKILFEQGYKCRICNIEAKELKKGLVVDHCHSTGKVRGLLCSKCNMGLGLFEDNPEFLASAEEYLKEN